MTQRDATRNCDELADAAKRLLPYLGKYSSPWCRHVLFSTLHHMAMGVDRRYESLVPAWFREDPWPQRFHADCFEQRALRWCPQCLARAYHSTAHQLAGLTHCPLHDVPMRSSCASCGFPLPVQPPEYAATRVVPFRDCPHCREPLLNLAECSLWPKTPAFLAAESAHFGPLFIWSRRVARIGRREFFQTEDASTGFTMWNDALTIRIATEAWLPLPRQIRVKRPRGLRTVCVWIDAAAARQPAVPEHDALAVFRSIRHYLAKQALPPRWDLSWRSGKRLKPRPRVAGDSDHFELWSLMHQRSDGSVRVSRSPDEVCTPYVLKLWAHRFLRDFDHAAGRFDVEHSLDISVYAVSTLFTPNSDDLMAPLGTAPGLIVESYYRRYLGKTKASERQAS